MTHQSFPLKVSITIMIGALLISAALAPLFSPQSASAASPNPGTPGAAYPHLQVIESTRDGIVFEFQPPSPQVAQQQLDGQACQSVAIDGLSVVEEVGQLALPVQGIMLGIPPDTQPDIRILSIDSSVLDESIRLCPTPEPIFSRDLEGNLTLTGYTYPQGDADDVNAFLPAQVAELASTGYIRFQRYAQLRLSPLQYNPVTGELRHHSRIQVEVRLNAPESLARSGSNRMLDPFFEDALAASLLNYEQAQAWRLTPEVTTDAGIATRETQPFYKIEVDQDGIYQLDYADLLDAGVPVNELDPRTFHLYNQDIEVAIRVEGEADGSFDPGDSVLFFGQKVDTKYTDTNAYWLTWGTEPGLRMAIFDGDPSGTSDPVPSQFLRGLYLEQDTLYISDVPSGVENDHWYWGYVDSYSGPFEITFEIANLAVGVHTATLRGLIKPYYSSLTLPIRIFLNNEAQPLFEGNLTTDPAYSFSVSFDQTRLVEGTNTLRVETVNSSDTILINWFELDYHALYIAEADQLHFRSDTGGTFNFQVDGFSSPSIEAYDLTNPLTPVRVINSAIDVSSAGYRLSFVSTVTSDNKFLTQETNQRLTPLSLTAVERSKWKSSTNGADYIIITHADFLQQAEALAAFRAAPDFRVQVIDVQELYDEFNGGVFSPEAIRDFLAHAFTSWQAPAPSFVLLLGDGHYDFKDFENTGQPYFIPPYLVDVDPYMGETAADNRYAAVSGDDILPDMYIGRFPVRTVGEAQSMVDNVINYELTPPAQDWHAQLTFVADNPDSGGNFPAESDKMITYVPPTYTNQKIYYSVNYTDATVARSAVISAVNEGRLILHYVGHGSLFRWASEGLLRLEDLVNFTNQGKLPLALPMTCLEGYFIRPNAQSLGESIVRMNDRGAIASYSPTGYGMAAGHALLDQSIFSHLFNHQQNQLGFLTTNAKYDLYAQSGAYRDLIDTYMLFGDPALRLQTLPAPLPAPTGLSATAVSSTQIDLAWTDNALDESAYRVERSPNGTDGWTKIADLPANSTTYSNTGLTPSTTYYYRVRAYRSGDSSYSAYSNTANATTLSTNEAPTNISLSNNTVAENAAVNTVVGTLSTSDPDVGDTHTYTLVSGDGSTDNASFNISGNSLRTSAVFDYETKNSYAIRIRSTDAGGLYFEKAFTINVTNVNEAPTNISLSNNTVAENAAVNTVVGTLSTSDPDVGDTHTYTLVSGDGSTDNASFNISGNSLRTSAVFDYETKNSYAIRIRSTDAGGLYFEKAFTINVTNVNEAPTNISLSNNTVAENAAVNTVVGTLSTSDPDVGDTHTYTLVSGDGSTDNASFNISGNSLRTSAVFDYETKNSYAIRIRSTDAGGLYFEKAFTINVTNVNEAPTNISLSNNTVAENEPVNTVVGTLSTSDPDVGDTHTYTLVSGEGSTDNASFNILGNSLRTSAVFNYETKNSYTIRIRSTDAGSLYFEKAFTINVTNVNEAPTNISLSNNTVAENEPVNTVVGTLSTSDPDVGDTHTYTLVSGDGSTDNASFNISGNSLRTSAVFNYETKNSYTIRIRSTDAGGLYFEKAFTINVTNVNEAPTNISLSNNTVAENAAVNTVVGTLSTSDPDVGDTHTYTLVSGEGSTDNASFNISENSLRTSAVFDYETKNSYAIRIRSTDAGGLYFEKAFTINVTNVNEAPTNISLSNNTVAENAAVNTVVGTLSTSDPDVGDTHTYTLVSGDGSTDNASFNILGNSLRTSAVFNYETKNSYTIRIRSTDAGSLYFEKAFTILVTGVNKPPIAVDDAYQTDMNQALIVGAPGILANDSDPDGDPLSAIIDIGTSNGTLNLSLNGAFTYTPNSGFSGVDQFTYMANDGEFSSNIATVTITVVDTNQAPTNISLSNNTVAENAAVNTVVGTLSTSDPDVGDTHTYTLVSGEGSTDNASFNISENSLRTSAVFDYETKNSYAIRIRSTDAGGLYFEKAFTINVTNVNEAPTNISLSNNTVAENAAVNTVVGTLSTSDPDVGDTHTYTLVSGDGSTDNASFNISGNSLRTSAVFDYETKNSYAIRIRSTDAGGLYFEKAFTINVTNVNEAPTNISLSNNTVAENEPVNTVVGTLSTSDPDVGDTHTYTLVSGDGSTDNASFNILGNSLRTSAVFNYETKNSYTIRIRSTDAGGLYFEKAFTINVTNVNEAPTNISLSNNTVAENAAVNTVVGTLSTSDPDVGDTHTYTLVSGDGSTDNASFNISGNSLRTSAVFDYETKNSYAIRIRSTDAGGLYFEKAFTINVTNVNEAPTNISLSNNTVAENEPVNTVVGTLSTSDPDVGDTHTYTLVSGDGSTDNASFNISGNSLRTSAVFNYETKNSYTIRIRSTDAGSLYFEKAFTILVTGVNKPPIAVDDAYQTDMNQALIVGAPGILANDSDPDGDPLSAIIDIGTSNGTLNLSLNGAFTYTPNSGFSGVDQFTYMANDGEFSSNIATVTITVVDTNQAPTNISLSNNTVAENAAVNTVVGTLSTSDPDVGDTHTYTLVSGEGSTDNASFNISENSLRTSAVFNYETKNSYTIRVRSTDAGGLYFEKVFTIIVSKVDTGYTFFLPLIFK
jgi:hypothetical protein